jgi:pimeloyl-ACP methyl ester carboxylesterase
VMEDDRVDLADPSASISSGLVFDPVRHTLAGARWPGDQGVAHWADAEIRDVQAAVDEQFPGRCVSLLGWDAERARFLILVGGDDGGRYFVFHRANAVCVEYFQRAKINAEEANHSEPLVAALPDGGHLAGTVLLPRHPPVAKPALLIWFHDGPWQKIAPGFQRDAQALATMGFVVAQFDYRGSTGYGLNHREAIRGAYDTVPVADAVAVIAAVAARYAFEPKRVAVGGEGFGGFLALRALELHPEIFRCGVAINAPLEIGQLREAAREVERRRREFLADLGRMSVKRNRAFASPEAVVIEPMNYAMLLDRPARPMDGVDFDHEAARAYFGGEIQLAKFSVTAERTRLTRPVLFLHDPANSDLAILPVQSFVAALTQRKQTAELMTLSPQFALGQPAARAAAFRHIGEFLNANLYDFKVEIGEVKEKAGPP